MDGRRNSYVCENMHGGCTVVSEDLRQDDNDQATNANEVSFVFFCGVSRRRGGLSEVGGRTYDCGTLGPSDKAEVGRKVSYAV